MPNPPFKFEQALAELEDITNYFESTDVDLDAGLVKFERGMELAALLKNHLAAVDNRVEKIKQKFADGSAPLPPDSESATPQPDLFEG